MMSFISSTRSLVLGDAGGQESAQLASLAKIPDFVFGHYLPVSRKPVVTAVRWFFLDVIVIS